MLIGPTGDCLCMKIIEMGPPSHASRAVSSAVVQLDRGDTAAEFQGKDRNSPKIHVLLFSSKNIHGEGERQTDRQRGCVNTI